MIISGFHIDGFGIYHDQGAQDLSGGLVLFLGDNECGKTTLMEFIRTVLFGFPRRDIRNLYPPLRGGNHGGRLQLLRQDGKQFTVERVGRQATIAEPGRAPEKAIPAERLLGGIDRNTFERVFAVDLKDLQGLGVLSQEGVGGRLFSAGAGLGAASVPLAMQNLDKELGNLLSQRGTQQRINQGLKHLKEAEAQIKELRGLATEYAAAQRQREQLEEQIKQCQSESEELRRKLKRLEQLQQAREPWVRCSLACRKAKGLEFAGEFPPNGLERLDNLKKDLDRLGQEQKAQQGEALRLAQELSRLTVDEVIISHQDAITALLGETGQLASALSDHPKVQSEMQQAEAEFLRRLKELGPDWDAARLAQVDTSVQVRQRVQEFGRLLDAAERHFEAAQAEARRRGEDAATAETAAEEAQRQWQELPLPPMADDRQLQGQQDAVRLLRPLLHQREVLATQSKDKLAAQQEAAARLARLKGQMEEPPEPWPGWLWLPVLLAGLTAAGVLAVWQRAYLAAGLALLAGAGLAAFFHFWRRRLRHEELKRLSEDQEQVAQAHKTLAEEINHFDRQMEDLDRELDRLAQEAALERPHDLTQLERLAGRVEDAARQWQEWKTRERERVKAEAQCLEVRGKLEKAAREADQASQELQRLRGEWEKWLGERKFSVQVRPPGFEAVLQAVESARVAQGNLQGYRQRLGDLGNYLTQTRDQIHQILDSCGRTSAAPEVGVEDLRTLGRVLEEALKAQRQQIDLERRLTEAQSHAARLGEEENPKEGELRELFQKAGARDEEEFRHQAASYQEWRDWLKEIEDNEIALRTLAGTEEAQAALEEELSQTEPSALQAEKEILESRQNELTDSLSKDNREVGDLNRRLADLAQNEKLGELLLEQRTLKEQLADATRRWATLMVCRHLLEQARSVYERERQPQVIQEADRFLNTMAQARYRLVSSVGEDSIQLEDRSSLGRKEEICWSAGLADQVYLAIRLGLAREFGRHLEPLPVILDDVLVKFDPTRRAKAARVILEFSREQQVLLFSCHPEFREIFARVRHDLQYRDALIACYTIADGVIAQAAAAV